MSAFISHTYTDRIEILTDGAVYDAAGVLVGLKEKVYRFRFAPAALTVRGAGEPMNMIGYALDAVAALSSGSFDAVLEFLPPMLDRMKGVGVGMDYEMLIAGISDTHGPLHVYFTTAAYADGIEAFKLYRMGDLFGGGVMVPVEEQDKAGITNAALKDSFAETGTALMELMRRQKGLNPISPDTPEIHGVGGHVDHTVIRADGVITTRLRTWPDVIGEKINPFAHDKEQAA